MQVFPCLQPDDWPLRDKCATVPLVPGKGFPVVALARGKETVEFLGKGADEKLFQEAVSNLRADEWRPALKDEKGVLLASCAEKILDADFLKAAKLGGDLLVAIPRRGAILACSNDADPAVKTVFYFLAEESWRSAAPDARLSSLLFLADAASGAIVAALPPPPRLVKDAYERVGGDNS